MVLGGKAANVIPFGSGCGERCCNLSRVIDLLGFVHGPCWQHHSPHNCSSHKPDCINKRCAHNEITSAAYTETRTRLSRPTTNHKIFCRFYLPYLQLDKSMRQYLFFRRRSTLAQSDLEKLARRQARLFAFTDAHVSRTSYSTNHTTSTQQSELDYFPYPYPPTWITHSQAYKSWVLGMVLKRSKRTICASLDLYMYPAGHMHLVKGQTMRTDACSQVGLLHFSYREL